MAQQDKSVVSFIKTMSSTKMGLETDVLKKVLDVVQSTDRGPASEILDLVFAITGYMKADVQGGESQIAGHCVSTLVKYLTLRAKEPTNESSESLDECLMELITQSVRLYGEVNANRGGTRVSLPLK